MRARPRAARRGPRRARARARARHAGAPDRAEQPRPAHAGGRPRAGRSPPRARPGRPARRSPSRASASRPTVAGWRALGLRRRPRRRGADALGRSGRVRARAFVAAGAVPADPAAVARRPLVKICGVTDATGIQAAVARRRRRDRAQPRPGHAAGSRPRRGRGPRRGSPGGFAAAARRRGSWPSPPTPPERPRGDRSRLSTRTSSSCPATRRRDVAAAVRPAAWKVLHLPAVDRAPVDRPGRRARGRRRPSSERRTYLDAGRRAGSCSTPPAARTRAGPGTAVDRSLAAAVARELPVDPRRRPRPGERRRGRPAPSRPSASTSRRASRRRAIAGERPRKDPLRVALFVKRARAARDGPADTSPPGRPRSIAGPARRRRRRPLGHRPRVRRPLRARDAHGRARAARDAPTPTCATTRASGPSCASCWPPTPAGRRRSTGPIGSAAAIARGGSRSLDGAGAARLPDRLRLYLKREDLAHTGAHKINNALGQALLTRRLGKTRVIAETGAGQHGVATATACALLDLPCVVYMGAEDIRAPGSRTSCGCGRSAPRSGRCTSGSATLKDAVNEAMRDWVTNVETTHYVLGSAMGPHPYPTIVRDLQRRHRRRGRGPARGGRGAAAGPRPGLRRRRLERDRAARPVHRRADGPARGRRGGRRRDRDRTACRGARRRHARHPPRRRARSCSRTPTARSSRPTRSRPASTIPGVGPQIAALAAAGRLELAAATDAEAVAAVRHVARTEGILPALETAHAFAVLPRLLAGVEGSGGPYPDDAVVLLGLSGRGDKDLAALEGRGREPGMTVSRADPSAPRPARRGRAAARRHGRRAPDRAPPSSGPAADGRAALIPYVVAGYPDAETSFEIALAAADAGRRPARDRPAVLRPAGRRRHAPARLAGRARRRGDVRRARSRLLRADRRGPAGLAARADGATPTR